MKKQTFTMSTGSCAALYELLRDAKLTGMDGAAKLRVVATLHSLRPAAHKLEAARKDCLNTLRPADFERRLQDARDFEQGKTPVKMQRSEYEQFISELQDYNRLVSEGIKTISEEPVNVNLITRDDYEKLITANDWTLGQLLMLSDFV